MMPMTTSAPHQIGVQTMPHGSILVRRIMRRT
jgi:hypothetical protein